MVRKFPQFRNRNAELGSAELRFGKRTTSGGSLQFPNGFSAKSAVPFDFQPKFTDFFFSLNGKQRR